MNAAEIIQQTYVEYLPDGTRRDRYRKDFLTKQQKINTNKRKRENNTKQKRRKEGKMPHLQHQNQTQQENDNTKTWHVKLPHATIEHITEEESYTTKPNTTKTVYTSYRHEGVQEWSINTSGRITKRHQTPDYHIDEEYEW